MSKRPRLDSLDLSSVGGDDYPLLTSLGNDPPLSFEHPSKRRDAGESFDFRGHNPKKFPYPASRFDDATLHSMYKCINLLNRSVIRHQRELQSQMVAIENLNDRHTTFEHRC